MADFGDNTFASRDEAWAGIPIQSAWVILISTIKKGKTSIVLSRRLAFFLCILTLLFCRPPLFALDCHGAIQSASIDKPPYPRNCAKCFYRLWASTDPRGRRHHKGCRYRQTTETLPNLKTFFEFGGTLELLTTTLFFSKHDIVISESCGGLIQAIRSIPMRSGSNSTIRTWVHISQLISFCFLPLSRIIQTGIPSSCQMVCKRACSTLSATYT